MICKAQITLVLRHSVKVKLPDGLEITIDTDDLPDFSSKHGINDEVIIQHNDLFTKARILFEEVKNVFWLVLTQCTLYPDHKPRLFKFINSDDLKNKLMDEYKLWNCRALGNDRSDTYYRDDSTRITFEYFLVKVEDG
jgi:hypothetical protein